jgi:hypothetical protein
MIDCVVTATNTEGSDESIAAAVGPVEFQPLAPSFTSQSTIDGVPVVGVGGLLTCTPGAVVGYPVPTITYQWRLDGVNITDETDATYTPVSGDIGSMIDCVVTATNTEGNDTDTTEEVGPVTSGDFAPEFTGASSITGNPYVDETLTCVAGTRVGEPTPTLSYQWRADAEDLVGETASTLVIDDTMLGQNIDCVVTATNTEGNDTSTAPSVGPVDYEPAIPVFTGASTITGDPYVGQTLTCVPGTRTGYPTPTLTYQWRASNSNISGATSSTWVVHADYIGDVIDCVVTATNASGNDTDTTADTAAVDYAPAAPVFTGSSVISGTAAVGSTLTCVAGARTGYPTPTLSYQWRDDGANISGATASTYALTSSEAGGSIDCVVTATNIHGNDTDTSNELGPVTTPGNTVPNFTGSTFIYGNAMVDETLTCEAGAVEGFPTPTLSYQWRADAVNIGGATSSTFVVTTTQYGAEIDCVVTATNTEGNDTSTSNSLGPVPETTPVTVLATGTPTFGGDVGGISVPWPAGTWTDKLAILQVETSNEAVPTPDGWEIMDGSPVSGGTAASSAGVRLSLFGKKATASEASVSLADPGDHIGAFIYVLDTELAPADAVVAFLGATTSSASNPYAMPVVTTPVDDCLLLFHGAPRNDSTAAQAANWSSAEGTITEHVDASTNIGNGGGVFLASVLKATAGTMATVNFDATTANVTLPRMTWAIPPNTGDVGPENTVLPAITGTPTEGETLSLSNGTWTLGTPTATLSYQWYRNDVAISAATANTYELVEADVGALISARVFASNTVGLVYAAASEVGPIDPFEVAPEGGIFGPEFGPEFE